MTRAFEGGSGQPPPDGLALRIQQAASAARQAAAEPGGVGRLVEALAEMGECLGQAEAELRRGQARSLREALQHWAEELRQLERLVGGGLELVSGWSAAAGLAAGYGRSGPEAAGRAVRVDETG